jgi:CheY-like chemotaxis protein
MLVHEVNSSLASRPPAHFSWESQAPGSLEQSTPGPSTGSITSSAVFSGSHPSALNSAPTERSNSIDSAAWHENADEDVPRDTVLLVEDNEVNLKLLMALMRKLKYKFLCAVNGREAVDIYRENHASILLVLMDISMPIMDGFTATVKIRESERRRRLPHCRIVALTGVTSEEAKRQAFASGIDEFFSKPVGMKELKALMSKLPDVDDSELRQSIR